MDLLSSSPPSFLALSMPVIGTYAYSDSYATFTIEGLKASVQIPLNEATDASIRSYDENANLFYVNFNPSKEKDALLTAELEKLNQEEIPIEWTTHQGNIALYRTEQSLVRVYIFEKGHTFTVFALDSGITHHHSHREHLFKIPEELKNFAPQAVPVHFTSYSTDALIKADCLYDGWVYVTPSRGIPGKTDNTLRTEEVIVYGPMGGSMQMKIALEKHNDFQKYPPNPKLFTCCFKNKNDQCSVPIVPSRLTVPSSTAPTVTPVSETNDGIDHTLLTCLVVGSIVFVIIIVIIAAIYLYKRYGNAISERHRRNHHGHRRHRNESKHNSEGSTPSSSVKREPLPIPPEDALPTIPKENVITRLPQYNIVSKEAPHSEGSSYSQVNRNISPMVQENSSSPNRAMTPVKTAEMSTQTYTMSATRSAEPAQDDDNSSNKAQPSGSRMAAGSASTSDLSETTLQPSLHSSIRATNESVCPPSISSSFVIGRVASRPLAVREQPALTRSTTADCLASGGPTMAEDVSSSEEEEDEDSVTRSVDDCERVLAAYKPPVDSVPAPVSAHRTKSHLSTRPQYTSTSDYSDSSANHSGHLISLPPRTLHSEEKRRKEEEDKSRRLKPLDLSRISVPTDLLTPRSRSTNSELQTAARRASTVSWLAECTQSSMGRSMREDDL